MIPESSVFWPRFLATSGFMVLGFFAIAPDLAPVGLRADSLPSPDLLFCLTAYCAPRWTKAVTILPVFLLGLGRDLLTGTPEGAGALTLVLAMVFISESRSWFTDRPFWSEWLLCVLTFTAMLAVQWFLTVIMFADPPDIPDLFQLLVITAVAYVPCVFILRFVFRIDDDENKLQLKGLS